MMSVGDGAPAWSPVLFVTDVYSGDIANLKSGSRNDSRAGQHSGCVTTWYVCVNHYCYFVVNLCIRKPVFILFCLYLFSNGHKCQAGRPGNRKCSMPAPWALFTYHVIYTGPLRELEKMLHRPRMWLPSCVINKHGTLHGRAPHTHCPVESGPC